MCSARLVLLCVCVASVDPSVSSVSSVSSLSSDSSPFSLSTDSSSASGLSSVSSVYSRSSVMASPAHGRRDNALFAYVGCFVDDANDRDFPVGGTVRTRPQPVF